MKAENENFADNLLSDVFAGVKDAVNAEDVHRILDQVGLNWNVAKEKLLLPDGKESGFFGVVRQDNRNCFSTCKAGYVPYQNSELAELLIRLSEKTGFDIHNGGEFNGGGKVYIQLVSPNKIVGIGKNADKVNGYITGINGHDGTAALKFGETNITISCGNTFMAVLRQLQNSVRHTTSMHDKVEAAIKQITGIVVEEKSLFDTFIKLAEVPVKQDHIVRIVKDVTGVDTTLPAHKAEKEYSGYLINRSKELLSVIGSEMAEKGETQWGLFSGVTNYTSHLMPVPKRENARLESLYTGTGFDINNKAFKLVKDFAGVN